MTITLLKGCATLESALLATAALDMNVQIRKSACREFSFAVEVQDVVGNQEHSWDVRPNELCECIVALAKRLENSAHEGGA